MEERQILACFSRLQGIAQTGKKYGKDIFDQERYQELSETTEELIQLLTDIPANKLHVYMEADEGYATPKVDIRSVVFNKRGELLLVEENAGKWSLPGGWGDIGYSPFEIAEKETREEAGIKVSAKQLIAVKDMAKHDYPNRLSYIYKFFVYCETEESQTQPGIETMQAVFFPLAQIKSLPISLERNSLSDLEMAFAYHKQPFVTQCD